MMIDLYCEIRKRYGNVRRARGYYIYTEKNIRLLDLWLDGGKMILGRRAGQANLVCKQFLDRGLTGALPTKAESQLQRALKSLLPAYSVFRWYETETKAKEIASTLLQQLQAGNYYSLPVWRPFEEIEHTAAPTQMVLVTPVYSVPFGIIAADKQFEARLPPSDRLFPPLLYSLARAFFDVKQKMAEQVQETVQNSDLKKRRFSLKRRRAALSRRAEVEALIPCVWKQEGWYLFPQTCEEDYPTLFFQALDAHVLISPEYEKPSILPDCESYTELIRFLKTRNA